MKAGIYRIRHADTGKVYVGSAANFARRWAVHRCHLASGRHHSVRLQRAWNKYGPGAFVFEVIECVPVESLREREEFHIALARACDPRRGYNCRSTAALRTTREMALKAWATRRARGTDKWTDERRARRSEAYRGRTLTAQHRANIAAAGKGRIRTDTSERLRRLWADPDARERVGAKISASQRGRVFTKEHRRKIAEAVSRRHAEGVYARSAR